MRIRWIINSNSGNSNGWTQSPPESNTCGINIQLIGDLERSSDGNNDGLELDRSVEASPPQSVRRNRKRVKLSIETESTDVGRISSNGNIDGRELDGSTKQNRRTRNVSGSGSVLVSMLNRSNGCGTDHHYSYYQMKQYNSI